MRFDKELESLRGELQGALTELSAFTGQVQPDPESTEWSATDESGRITATVSTGGRLESVEVSGNWRPDIVPAATGVLDAAARALSARFGLTDGDTDPAETPKGRTPTADEVDRLIRRQMITTEDSLKMDEQQLAAAATRTVDDLASATDDLEQIVNDDTNEDLTFSTENRRNSLTVAATGMLTGLELDDARMTSPVIVMTTLNELLEKMHDAVPASDSAVPDMASMFDDLTTQLGI